MRIFEDEIVGTINTFHFLDHRVGGESIERFSFCNADIEKIFFKSEIFSSDFEVTDIVPFCSIDIKNPYIVDSKNSDHKERKNICLSEAESIIFSRSFSFGEKKEWITFHDQYVCIHNFRRGLFFFNNSQLRTSTSLILFHFQVCREEWFFGYFFDTSRNDVLSSEFISFSLEIWRENLLDESIFERMECYDCASSSAREKFDSIFERCFNRSEFIVDGDPNSLKTSDNWFGIITGFFDQFRKFFGCFEWFDFPCFDYRFCDKSGLWFFSIIPQNFYKFFFAHMIYEIICCLPLSFTIETHIEFPSKSEWESTIRIIEVCAGNSQIIADGSYIVNV